VSLWAGCESASRPAAGPKQDKKGSRLSKWKKKAPEQSEGPTIAEGGHLKHKKKETHGDGGRQQKEVEKASSS